MIEIDMDSFVPNLWGNLGVLDVQKTPTTILKNQAIMLRDLTDGAVEGIVERGQYTSTITLYIQIPSISDLKVRIVDVKYVEDSPYPVRITGHSMLIPVDAQTEEEFVCALKTILSGDAVKKSVAFLMAEAQTGI